jgi:hypothetical protein
LKWLPEFKKMLEAKSFYSILSNSQLPIRLMFEEIQDTVDSLINVNKVDDEEINWEEMKTIPNLHSGAITRQSLIAYPPGYYFFKS